MPEWWEGAERGEGGGTLLLAVSLGAGLVGGALRQAPRRLSAALPSFLRLRRRRAGSSSTRSRAPAALPPPMPPRRPHPATPSQMTERDSNASTDANTRRWDFGSV